MKGWNKIVVVFAVLLAAFLCKNLLAGQVGQPSPVDNINSPDSPGIRNGVMTSGDACPTREELITKTKTLQMPFIANNGQADGQVAFYAKTFGGTVFVTKDGEIVYSLPSGRDVPAGASPSPSPQVHGRKGTEEQGCSGAWMANGYSPFLRADNADCPPDRVLTKSLLAAYLPELQEGTGRFVGTRSPVSLRLAYLPGLQKETTQRVVSTSMPPTSNVQDGNIGNEPLNNPQSKFQNPKSPIRSVALKESLLGAKVAGITGEQPAVTTVNYFTGNDQSKWKTNVPTFDMVNLGEVYHGIELSLKTYSNNVEKLFCVKPGASPELIKVQLDGSKSLRVNQEGQLEVDTELGIVKFTKPVAYQEIDGKRVEVECEYTIVVCGVQNAEYKTNPQSTTSDSPIPHSTLHTPHSEYSFTVASYDKTKDLIIDPLLASTYLGGSGQDKGYSLALDTTGNVYVTGITTSADFPTTSGAYDTSYDSGDDLHYGDVFISKLNSGLTNLLASTFLGGHGTGNSLTLDTSGNVYVMGETTSSYFPTTSDAYDTSRNGLDDIFISKLDGNLSANTAKTTTIEASPKQLLLNKYSSDDVTITVKSGNYLVRDATVTATIRRHGNKIIAVLPASKTTDIKGGNGLFIAGRLWGV